jgi:hypothetical protein
MAATSVHSEVVRHDREEDHRFTLSDAGGSGHYFTTCSDGRLSFSVVTMVSAIWTVLEMTSVP